ncbi:choice-of-anchor G family protein [Arthrobacter sp. MAHUQ-56]
MKAGKATKVRNAVGKPRLSLTVAAVAAASLLATTTVTTAAWTDNEWAGGTVGVGSPGDCTTNTLFSSRAAAQQLSGSVLGVELSTLAGVEGLTVTNTDGAATPAPVTATTVTGLPDAFLSKLPVTVLGDNPVTAALGLGAPVGSLGTYTQWAQAQEGGQARAAAGLVTDQSGAVDVTGTATGAGTAPDSARISLGKILPDSLAGVTLNIGAVASSASLDACALVNGWPMLAAAPAVEREYGIAGLDLAAEVPAAGAVSTGGAELVAALPGELDALTGTGRLATAISDGMQALVEPLLGTLGSSVSTTVALSVPELSPVAALMTGTITDADQAVAIDLAAGTVRVDVARLAGGTLGLNGQSANHAVLVDGDLAAAATARVSALLSQWKARVLDALAAALQDVTLEATTTIRLLGLLDAPVAEIEVGTGPATLGQFLADRAPAPRVKTAVLGAGIGGELLGSVVAALTQGANGVVRDAVKLTIFDAGLIPAAAASLQRLLDPVPPAVGTVLAKVGDAVSIHVNVQPDQAWPGTKPADVAANAGEYSVSAVRVGVLDRPDLLSLSLGNSQAGPVKLRNILP